MAGETALSNLQPMARRYLKIQILNLKGSIKILRTARKSNGEINSENYKFVYLTARDEFNICGSEHHAL